jgi:hypothetical protein
MRRIDIDALAQFVATHPLSRRRALSAGGLGLAAAALAWSGEAAAQGTPATPAAPSAPTEVAANDATLFVQTASGGTLVANPTAASGATPAAASGHGAYRLTLKGHTGETIAFSDRPARQFGQVPTSRFFKSMGFTPANPPNAALVADTAQQQGAVVLVELLNPTYDGSSQTLTYEANLLQQYPNARGQALASIAAHAQTTPAAAFTNASLFIDDCPDIDPMWCYVDCDGNVPGNANLGAQGQCWNWNDWMCEPCNGWDGTAAACNKQFSACNGQCFTNIGAECGGG